MRYLAKYLAILLKSWASYRSLASYRSRHLTDRWHLTERDDVRDLAVSLTYSDNRKQKKWSSW